MAWFMPVSWHNMYQEESLRYKRKINGFFSKKYGITSFYECNKLLAKLWELELWLVKIFSENGI